MTLSGLVHVCVFLAVGALALRDDHKPCCAPAYFTYDLEESINYERFGDLVVEDVVTHGAYDSISEQIGLEILDDYFNGTENRLRAIADYKKGVVYTIIKSGDSEVCFEQALETRFQKNCIPAKATFVGEETVGDHALTLDVWYIKDDEGDTSKHIVFSIQHEGCIPVVEWVREFDFETGEELGTSRKHTRNFNLGICDPESYFKPPSSCTEDRIVTSPTGEMLKLRAKFRGF